MLYRPNPPAISQFWYEKYSAYSAYYVKLFNLFLVVRHVVAFGACFHPLIQGLPWKSVFSDS